MKRKLCNPLDTEPFELSRSKIELFCGCPFCFYLDRKLGIAQPGGLPFNLNSAVDHLLKKEFDLFRERGEPHPLMLQNKIDAIPYQHIHLNDWRKNQKGISYLHEQTRFLVTGAIDEIWVLAQTTSNSARMKPKSIPPAPLNNDNTLCLELIFFTT